MTMTLSDSFLGDLKEEDGLLYPIMNAVRHDHTLMLAIRNNYINLYYRGGNLMRIEQRSNHYALSFDENYCKGQSAIPEYPKRIITPEDTLKFISVAPLLKRSMDYYFSYKPKLERETQQQIVRENNFTKQAKKNPYFIADIEFSDKINGYKFDMVGIRRDDATNKTGRCTLVLIEIKYGDAALDGKSGVTKHLKDFKCFISDEDKYKTMTAKIQKKINQLDYLGIINFNRPTKWDGFKIESKKPEVIFIFANHTPKSSVLQRILTADEIVKFSEKFDLKFYVSKYAGYVLHPECMLSYNRFYKLLDVLPSSEEIDKQ